jgi:hypothetical protein
MDFIIKGDSLESEEPEKCSLFNVQLHLSFKERELVSLEENEEKLPFLKRQMAIEH